jgi:hypothetical protein
MSLLQVMKSLPKCRFREWLWGPKSHWPTNAQSKEEEKAEKLRRWKLKYPEKPVLCKCGVEAKYGLVPSHLGIGYWCGHMVDYDEVYHCRLVTDCFVIFIVSLWYFNMMFFYRALGNASGRG